MSKTLKIGNIYLTDDRNALRSKPKQRNRINNKNRNSRKYPEKK